MQKHFTSTVYIVAKFKNDYKVLLHNHKKLHKWIGIGGHIETGENPVETALREVKEETSIPIHLISIQKDLLKTSGVKELPQTFTILEERIPRYKSVPAHIHIDLIYFAIANNPEKIVMNEEYRWFKETELDSNNLPPEVKYIAGEAIKRCSENI